MEQLGKRKGLPQNIHVACCKGSGMRGVMEALMQTGFSVTGSDRALGNETLPEEAELLVRSSAMKDDHPLVTKAAERGIPCVHRMEVINLLMELLNKKVIIVLGSHGKTSTSSMLASTLDCSFIIGGQIIGKSTYAEIKDGEFCVLEGDESDRSFEKLLAPFAIIVTSLSPEHLEAYDNNFANLKTALVDYIEKCPGSKVVNVDDANIQDALQQKSQLLKHVCGVFTGDQGAACEGIETGFDMQTGKASELKLKVPGGAMIHAHLQLLGKHFVANAACVAALCWMLKVPVKAIESRLTNFQGAHRRMELLGEAKGVVFIDDYAHHPREIATSIAAATNKYHGPITIIFEPHKPSRFKSNWDDFGKHLSKANKVFVLPVFGAENDDLRQAFVAANSNCCLFEEFVLPETGVLMACGAVATSGVIKELFAEARKENDA